jgi:hypothetical protein
MVKHPPRIRIFVLLSACLTLAMLAGCQKKGIQDLVSNQLFTLSLGTLDDQINLFQFENAIDTPSTTVFMRDGWFYVANGNSGKVMVFSSYGDLIYLLYNPQKTPTPTILGPLDPNATDEASTRGYIAYPFADIGKIAVASDRTLYVEDSVPEAKMVKDVERGLTRTQIILRFDRRGRPLGSIGEEGVGGSPFPFISAIHVTAKDQLVVTCRLPDYSWEVYWYDKDGTPLYQVQIGLGNLPVKDQKGVTTSLVDLVPDPENPLLYAVVYSSKSEPAARPQGSSASQDTIVVRAYKLDLRTRKYSPNYVEFPQNPPLKEKTGLKATIPAPPSDLLGVGLGGYYYLLAYTDTNIYTLQILDSSGKLLTRRRVAIEDSTLVFRDVHLSSSGIIYGLFADQDKATVSWWRSDLVLKGE